MWNRGENACVAARWFGNARNSDLSQPTNPGDRISRRRIAYLLIAGTFISVAGMTRWVSAQKSPSVADAIHFLQQSGDKLVAILNGPSGWPVKTRQVQALIEETMDVYGIARFALGRTWNAASEAQRSEIVRLFPQVLIGNVGRAVGAYQGISFIVHRGTQIDDTVEVATTILRPEDAPRDVVWFISNVNGAPKIVDIGAEGTSLRITQRDDCASFLAHNNHSIPALIETLRVQAEAALRNAPVE